MALPVNVDTCAVVGSFVYADGTAPTGIVEFVPTPIRLLDAGAVTPSTILSGPIVAVVDTTGTVTATLPATDDTDLNPTGWTYRVHVRLHGTGPAAHYSFDMEAPAGETIDLTAVTPAEASDGTLITVGPVGPEGPEGPPSVLVEDPADSDLYYGTVLELIETGPLVEDPPDSSLFYGTVVDPPYVYTDAGTPEGALTAPVGSLYLRSDGGAGTTLYVKESGVGDTGWIAK